MIDCISAACCVSRECSSKTILFAPFIAWVAGSVFLATKYIKSYAELEISIEDEGIASIIIILFVLCGAFAIIVAVLTLSNIIQVLMELSTAKYALILQKYIQSVSHFILLAFVLIEVLLYHLIDEEFLVDQLYDNLLKTWITCALLFPFTLSSHCYYGGS